MRWFFILMIIIELKIKLIFSWFNGFGDSELFKVFTAVDAPYVRMNDGARFMND